jgi:hypothetical protein
LGHQIVLFVKWGHLGALSGRAAKHTIKSASTVMAAAQVTADFTPCQGQINRVTRFQDTYPTKQP